MKKVKKGFTLVELLIVIAIIGILSAAMMVSFGSSTATAKASTIAANIDACMLAARIYYAGNINEDLTTKDASEFLSDTSTYVPNWKKFSVTDKNIVYGVDSTTTGKGADKWAVQVDFSSAPDAAQILAALVKIPGYSDTEATGVLTGTTYKFKVTLLTGTVGAFVTQGS